MTAPKEKPKITIKKNDNAFSIMGAVSKVLKKASADNEYIEEYFDKATSGDYNHLLNVTTEYVDIA